MTTAVRREVIEEMGITIDVTGMVGVFSDPGHVIAYADGEVRQEFSICFRARPVSGSLRGSDESSESMWAPVANLDKYDMHASNRLRIERARSGEGPYFT